MDGLSTTYSQPAAQMLVRVDWYSLAVFVALFVFAWVYAYLVVRRLRRRDPESHHTAWLVAVGDAAIAIAFTLLTNLASGALLLALMAVAGAPMIWEYVDDVSSRNRIKIGD